jgi:hypothetical protein
MWYPESPPSPATDYQVRNFPLDLALGKVLVHPSSVEDKPRNDLASVNLGALPHCDLEFLFGERS